MTALAELRVKIFADGADKAGMLEMYRNDLIKGFTTNPTLMRKAGITDYRAFARDILRAIPDKLISFEVFSDDFEEMQRQACRNCRMGRQRICKNTSDQHARTIFYRIDPPSGEDRHKGQRDRADDARPGSRDQCSACTGPGELYIGLRRTHC